LHFLFKDNRTGVSNSISFFSNSLFYYLKYRDFDAKAIELMLIAFKAGEHAKN
jgi:hypothetical protein